MTNISLDEANAWLESTKLTLTTLDDSLEMMASTTVISLLDNAFDVTTWLDVNTTPKLVRTLISMYYTSWVYDKHYADDSTDTSNYSYILRRQADRIIAGLNNGSIILAEQPDATDDMSSPSFFPNDASSANEASSDFPSDGGPYVTIGQVF